MNQHLTAHVYNENILINQLHLEFMTLNNSIIGTNNHNLKIGDKMKINELPIQAEITNHLGEGRYKIRILIH